MISYVDMEKIELFHIEHTGLCLSPYTKEICNECYYETKCLELWLQELGKLDTQ